MICGCKLAEKLDRCRIVGGDSIRLSGELPKVHSFLVYPDVGGPRQFSPRSQINTFESRPIVAPQISTNGMILLFQARTKVFSTIVQSIIVPVVYLLQRIRDCKNVTVHSDEAPRSVYALISGCVVAAISLAYTCGPSIAQNFWRVVDINLGPFALTQRYIHGLKTQTLQFLKRVHAQHYRTRLAVEIGGGL